MGFFVVVFIERCQLSRSNSIAVIASNRVRLRMLPLNFLLVQWKFSIRTLQSNAFSCQKQGAQSTLSVKALKHNTSGRSLHRSLNTFTCRFMINRLTGKLRYSSRCCHLLSVTCHRVWNKDDKAGAASLPPALTLKFTRIRYEHYPT